MRDDSTGSAVSASTPYIYPDEACAAPPGVEGEGVAIFNLTTRNVTCAGLYGTGLTHPSVLLAIDSYYCI